MKPDPTLIEEQMCDILDAWHIATHVDQATEFKKRYPFLANDIIYTYRLSYCALLCKLLDPAKQKAHMNLCFESEVNSMKSSPGKI